MKNYERDDAIIDQKTIQNDVGVSEEYEKVPLTQKRLLDIKEFQRYTSLGKNRAAELARESGAALRFGRRVLIDRVKFDAWCDAQ